MRRTLISITIMLALLAAASAAGGSLVNIAYDDSVPEDALWLSGQLGHAVVFTAPADNWSLSKVNVLGMINPNATSEMFAIEVWDENLTLLSRTSDRAAAYFGENLSWATIDLPEVSVSGDFLVCLFEYGGVFVGVDAGTSSGRSVLVSRNPNRIMNWSLQNLSQNQTDWMIQAYGQSFEPQFELTVLSDKASDKSPARLEVKAQDPDGNLNSAMLFIMDNKTHEVVWSEARPMAGSSDKEELSWPAVTFSIASGGADQGAIYAASNWGAAENVSSLLTYYAPCITEIEENQTASTKAYFGEDGRLNALVDTYGFALYVSEDLLKVTSPDTDYGQFAGNISLIPSKSRILFLKMLVPTRSDEEATQIVGPVVLSGTASSGYDIVLQKHSAGMGEYIALVRVDDQAYNQVSRIADKTIKVA
ncbi:MAG TPA: hypothetical protein PLJ25_07605 [Methanothrix sp.]|nr:hypothetical protein [Methanothrix sp.]